MTTETNYLDAFEQRLEQQLLRLATAAGELDGTLLASPDIDERWKALAPEYMADAVPQVADYPTVALAWASYLGLALAHGWDKDWEAFSRRSYQSFYGSEGFDNMDDFIVSDILGLQPGCDEAQRLADIFLRLARAAVDAIRHEQIEPQSAMAFHAFARAVRLMFRLGAAIELKRLGYRFEAMPTPGEA